MTSALDLSGELVLISGAAGGLGRPICERLAGLGAMVAAVDLHCPETAEPGPGISWYGADAGDEEAVGALLDDVEEREGRLPSVVCCHAGLVHAYPILEFPLAEFDDVMRANVRTAFVLAQGAARRWRDAGVPGHLIFTCSWVKDFPWPEIAPYSASKAALWSLTRSFAKELAPYRIRANAVLPGIVSVGMARRQWDEDEGYRARASKAIALGVLQDPRSVADAFAFLCSPLASYMTGSALRVDGGCSLLGVE